MQIPSFATYDREQGAYILHEGVYKMGSRKISVDKKGDFLVAVNNLVDLNKTVEPYDKFQHYWSPILNKVFLTFALVGLLCMVHSLGTSNIFQSWERVFIFIFGLWVFQKMRHEIYKDPIVS